MSYDLMFQKAMNLQNNGALNEAEAIYLQMLQVMPHNSDVWNLLGLIAQSKNNHLRAVDCFLEAIKYAPVPFSVHYFNLGLSYKSLNKGAEAKEALEKATTLTPALKEAFNYLGVLQAEMGDKENAVKSFCKALDIEDDYEDARVNLCFYTNDLYALKKIADENENCYYAQLKMAELVEDLEQKGTYLQRALQNAPDRIEVLLAMALYYAHQSDFNNSLTYYHKVLNLDENNIQALLGVADNYLALNMLDKAENYYCKSFNLTRDIAGAHLNYGIVLYRQKRLGEALEEYRLALNLAPDTPEISYNLALILKETGDYEEALGLMFNAHLKDPQHTMYSINIMETLNELFRQNAELALKIAENWQKQEPENLFSKRILAGITGVQQGDDDLLYTQELFDVFAESYDDTLNKLEPKIISKFKEINGDIKGRVLDLGCGTGLAGVMLKNDKNSFDGVDVSAKMLGIAREKGVYSELYQKDIVTFLRENPVSLYDLVVGFDVFCYLGNLQEIFSLLKGKKIWFSIEVAEEDRNSPYYLTPTGRYKHKESYVVSQLKACGFEKIIPYPLVLRTEGGEDVRGILFVAAPVLAVPA